MPPIRSGLLPGNEQVTSENTALGEYGFRARQCLLAYGGHIYSVYTSNTNGLFVLSAFINTATITTAAGPRVIYGDDGPLTTDSTAGYLTRQRAANAVVTYNNTFASDGTRQLTGFVVQFDRPVDVSSFTTSDVTVEYQNPNTGVISFITPSGILPLDENTGFGPEDAGADTVPILELRTESGTTVTIEHRRPAGLTRPTGLFAVGDKVTISSVNTPGYKWRASPITEPLSGNTFTYTAAAGLTSPAVVTLTGVNLTGTIVADEQTVTGLSSTAGLTVGMVVTGAGHSRRYDNPIH